MNRGTPASAAASATLKAWSMDPLLSAQSAFGYGFTALKWTTASAPARTRRHGTPPAWGCWASPWTTRSQGGSELREQ